jgi:hypothetical protein
VMLVYAVVGVERPGIRVIGEYATEPQCLAALVDVPPAVKNWGCFSYLPHAGDRILAECSDGYVGLEVSFSLH